MTGRPPIRRIMLVGVGRHAERIYVPLLAQLVRLGEVELTGVVELRSRHDELLRIFGAHSLQVPTLTLLSDDEEAVLERMLRVHAQTPFDALLICCDPRHRSTYFELALRTGSAVFVDKPIFVLDDIAHDEAVAVAYAERLFALEQSVRAAGIHFVVQAQRRAHEGYRYVSSLIDGCVEQFGVPVTTAHIQHADGMWVQPNEWGRDYHPFKYGFGKLFHSGYHFVDLLAWLVRSSLERFGVSSVEAAVKATFAADSLRIWQDHPLLPPASPGQVEPVETHFRPGEHDVHALLDFRNALGTVSVAELSLLQSSFSDRDPAKPVADPYKGIGRVRHERVDVKVSSLLNVQVHSYQSRSTRGATEGDGPGEADHFEILVFRHPKFFSAPSFEKVTLWQLAPETARAHNEWARGHLFRAFLRRERTGSELSDHLLSGLLTTLLYRGLARGAGRLAVVSQSLSLPPLFANTNNRSG